MKQNAASAGVIEPYAEALMSLAESQSLTDQFGENANAILQTLTASPDLSAFFENPFTKGESKKAVVRQLFESEVHPYFLNFLLLLVDRRRIFLLSGICQQYRVLLRKLRNTVLAEVTSTIELSEAQRAGVIQKVKELSQAAEVELDTKIEPELIGGVIIKVGSQVLDASIRGQLRRIGVSLLNPA
ncbi:MAG: F0F1 ATP synthase subunit delta [Thermosynechococcaceae cyanobacterium MS004]|nr:F0F1 ATP synthase subunit delta [Thermosynechococcaceae cyanobacterium MS004]